MSFGGMLAADSLALGTYYTEKHLVIFLSWLSSSRFDLFARGLTLHAARTGRAHSS
jgi:hypothetical protein